MTIEQAFATIDTKYRQEILAETWGHLAMKKNHTYRGTIIIGWGEYDSGHLNPTIIQDNMGIDGSPWWYETIHNYLNTLGKGISGTVKELHLTVRNYGFWCTNTRTLVKPAP